MLGWEAGGAVGRYRQVCVMMVVAGVEGFTCTRTTHHLTHLRRRVDSSDILKAYSKDWEGSTVWKR